MAEVRTTPVTAQRIEKPDFHELRTAGSFRVSGKDSDGAQQFWFFCPCGCGHLTWLTVGDKFKPAEGPSWEWDGNLSQPTLSPSVHRVGHWHGWLRNGVWESC